MVHPSVLNFLNVLEHLTPRKFPWHIRLLLKNLIYCYIKFPRAMNRPSPVIESCKNFWVQRTFLFHVIIWPYDFRNNLVETSKWSTSPKIPDFRNGGKSPWRLILYVGSNVYNLYIVGNFIRIDIVLRTKIQEWTYFELLIENW